MKYDEIFLWACEQNWLGTIKILIEDKIEFDWNAKDKNGYTGLDLAYQNGHQEIVEIILSHIKQNIAESLWIAAKYKIELINLLKPVSFTKQKTTIHHSFILKFENIIMNIKNSVYKILRYLRNRYFYDTC